MGTNKLTFREGIGAEAHSEPSQTLKPSFAKSAILDVWQSSEYASEY